MDDPFVQSESLPGVGGQSQPLTGKGRGGG